LLCLAYAISRITNRSKAILELESDDFYLNAPSQQSRQRSACVFLLQAIITACICGSTALFAWVINLSEQVIPVTVIGTIALSEYYHSTSATSILSNILMIVMSTCATWVTSINFTQRTLFYLVYQFNWHVIITMSQFSLIFSIIIALSVLLPAIVTIPQSYHKKNSNISNSNKTSIGLDHYTSNASSSSGSNRKGLNAWNYVGNVLFEIMFVLSVVVFAALELIVREQVNYVEYRK